MKKNHSNVNTVTISVRPQFRLGSVHKERPHKIAKNWLPSPLSAKMSALAKH